MCYRPKHDFLSDGTAVPVWPPADTLSSIAQDDTILVTSATCAYADLLTNWLKHVWDLQIKCFFVAAADQSTANFIDEWMPQHSSEIPDKFVNQVRVLWQDGLEVCIYAQKSCVCFTLRCVSVSLCVGGPRGAAGEAERRRVCLQVKKFAQKETPEYTRVVQSKPEVLRAILAQGYNVAWSDADVAWVRNPFTLFDKAPDLVLAWADNSEVTAGGVMQPGEFPGSMRTLQLDLHKASATRHICNGRICSMSRSFNSVI